MSRPPIPTALLLLVALHYPVRAAAQDGASDEGAASPEDGGDAPDRDVVERARNHFNAGRAYYEDGRYEDAVREFAEAHRLTGHPDVLYNLAQAYDRLGRRQDAVERYRQYLDDAETPPDRARVEQRIEELELMMRAEDAGDAPVRPPRPPPDGGPGIAPWIAFGTAGVLAVGAAITGGMALSTHASLSDECPMDRCSPEHRDDIDSGSTLSTVSTILTAGAVVGAGVGVGLLLFGGGGEEEASGNAAVEIVPGPAPAGAGARVTF